MKRQKNRRLGILGGTFNPPHLGHLILAQAAIETNDMEKVIFIPCAVPPHKRISGLASAEHRLAMVQLAVEGDHRFEVSDMEIRRGGVSYAIDTVRGLREQHTGMELCFIIGADSLKELHQWKSINDLLPMCRFVTFARQGFAVSGLKPDELKLGPVWGARLLEDVVGGREIGIASSDIRHRVAEGLSIRYLVPDAVDMYIAEHHMYTR